MKEHNEDILEYCPWHASQCFEIKPKSDKAILQDCLVDRLCLERPSKYFNPIAYTLVKLDWKIFGTLTFENEGYADSTNVSEYLRQNEFDSLITATCAQLDLRPRNLVYYGKSEFGGGGHGHFNFLIGEDCTKDIPANVMASTMLELWKRSAFERIRGIAKIEPFLKGSQIEAVLYQSKREFDNGIVVDAPDIISPMLKKITLRNL